MKHYLIMDMKKSNKNEIDLNDPKPDESLKIKQFTLTDLVIIKFLNNAVGDRFQVLIGF